MKINSVQLASLVLFLVSFTSGMAMEDWHLVENLPSLPSDVKKVIATKTLRLILDEAEDHPEQLMEPSDRLEDSFKSYITPKFLGGYPKTPLIDTIIFLMVNGADPNTKNYNGHTTFHLLMFEFLENLIGIDSWHTGLLIVNPVKDFLEHVENLALKIKLLQKLGINLNEKFQLPHILRNWPSVWNRNHSFFAREEVFGKFNVGGPVDKGEMTMAYALLFSLLPIFGRQFRYGIIPESIWSFLALLRDLGMNFNEKLGFKRSPCEWIQDFISKHKDKIDQDDVNQFNEFCGSGK